MCTNKLPTNTHAILDMGDEMQSSHLSVNVVVEMDMTKAVEIIHKYMAMCMVFLMAGISSALAGTIRIHAHDYQGWQIDPERIQWASFSVQSSSQGSFNKVSAEDVKITESIIDNDGKLVLGPRMVNFKEKIPTYEDSGFWRYPGGSIKVDLVFILKEMNDDISSGVVREIKELIGRLQDNGIDFRVAAFIAGNLSDPDNITHDGYSFYNFMEVDKFLGELDHYGGVGSDIGYTYDALLS